LNGAGNELNIVVLDACRDNPFGWGRGGSRGLTVVEHQSTGSIIAFATAAGSVAADGTGQNGLYTTHFLKNLRTPGISVHELFNKTGADVISASGGQQIPALYSQFFGVAYLGTKPGPNPNPDPNPSPVVSLYEQLTNATGTTTITVTQDTPFQGVVISKASSIVLCGDKAGRTVFSPDNKTYLIRVERGVTLTLENITLKGISVSIREGGTLLMNNGSTITGCVDNGVRVEGTFIMNGGSITNNADGGVYVYPGTFTMNDGRIANNKGSGVSVYGTFTMKNGRIENNTASSGGGVYVCSDGKFYMQGGVIAGNRAGDGGGVCVAGIGNPFFKMTGGTIYGLNGGSNANTASRKGNAVWEFGFFVDKIQNRTIYKY
jgi:hypothetical protein